MLENMRQAIAAVRSVEKAYRTAKLFMISRSTLERRLENPRRNPYGGTSLYTQVEEQTLKMAWKR